ncbi:unnamed protein product [Prunus brigantina]
MEHRNDHAQPEQGRNSHPINALNDMGALQRMIREMMEPEARRGERSTYRKPYPAYIDHIPQSLGTYHKSLSSSVHLLEVESKEDTESSEEREIAVAEMAKLKHPVSCKALTKPLKDQKPPPFTGGFVPNKSTQNKVYSIDLTKVDALFDEMLLQKAIETPHRLPKPEELKADNISGGTTLGTIPPTVVLFSEMSYRKE